MWRNYLAVATRTLTKNKMFAFINIFGLAVGLAACLLLLIYVRHEMSYDRWLPEHERVFQVQTFGTDPDTGERIAQQGVTQPVTQALVAEFPQIEAASRFEGDDATVLMNGQAILVDRAFGADAGFFDIIQVPFLRGDRATALRDPQSVVLSRSEALRLFGTVDVLGRTLVTVRSGQNHDLRVTGVFEDLPGNSHMAFDLVRRFTSEEAADCPWGCVSGLSYVKLRPGVNVESIHSRMQAWEQRHVPESVFGGYVLRARFDWRLTNVADVHLGEAKDDERPGNDLGTLATYAIIALLILGVACVNFVNLATARASQRAREVAVRKVLGASRGQLVGQFLAESMLLVLLAMLIALTLVEVALPAFSAMLGADLAVRYLGAGGLALPVLVLTLIVGLAGGLYPAFYLSRYRPSAVLKANKSAADTPGSQRLRTGLVVVQFAVSIGLIICTAVVYRQTVFARTADPGFEREGLLAIRGLDRPEAAAVRETLTREIVRLPGVENAAGAGIVPGSGQTMLANVRLPGRSSAIEIGWYSAEPSFFETMKTDLIAGRQLSAQYANDSFSIAEQPGAAIGPAQMALAGRGLNIVVNESAVRRLGFASPAAAVGRSVAVPVFGDEVAPVPATIVGVVEDARYRSLRQAVEPIAYYDPREYRWLAVRFAAEDPEQVRAQIERVWRRLVPGVPFQAEFADASLARLYEADEARGQTFAGFSLLAVLIACLGLFGLAAFTAERRTREIGIRKVFGARSRDIVRLLAWQFSKPVIVANVVAWPVAWWMMRDWLNGFDSRIALGPEPFVLAGAVALAIALGTIVGHALRVSRTSPIKALRYE